VKALNDLEVHM